MERLKRLTVVFYAVTGRQMLNIGENAVVEVAEAWGGMTSLVDLDAQVRWVLRQMGINSTLGDRKQTVSSDVVLHSSIRSIKSLDLLHSPTIREISSTLEC